MSIKSEPNTPRHTLSIITEVKKEKPILNELPKLKKRKIVDEDLKEKILSLDNSLKEDKIKEIIETSKRIIITKKSSFNDCLQAVIGLFKDDKTKAKEFVEYFCEMNNVPIKFSFGAVESCLKVINHEKKKISSETFLKLKRKKEEKERNIEEESSSSYSELIEENEDDLFSNAELIRNYYSENYSNYQGEGLINHGQYNCPSFNSNSVSNFILLGDNDLFGSRMIEKNRVLREVMDPSFDKFKRKAKKKAPTYRDDPLISKRDKIKKKCNKWPLCKDLNCPFYHPTEMCEFFPNCKFGNKCLKIHPAVNCKFGDKCKNPNCPFVHNKK